MGTAASTVKTAEQVIHHAYIDWMQADPEALAESTVRDVGEFIERHLAEQGFRIVREGDR